MTTQLDIHTAEHLKSRIPCFELSYESVLHNKVPTDYDVQMAIPSGKKYFLWFTFLGDKNVCILLEMNRDKKMCSPQVLHIDFDGKLSIGTLLYGVYLQQYKTFIVEDIMYYKGIHLKLTFGKKLVYIKEFLDNYENNGNCSIVLPVMRKYEGTRHDIELMYSVHHYQYRSLHKVCPFLNESLQRDAGREDAKIDRPLLIPPRPDFRKPQYKYATIFVVKADIQFDIYHLFAYGKDSAKVYYNVAYIPDYATSVFMNGIFRNIKENRNLDYIEESDDEDDFQDTREDKYVDLNKEVTMECVFHPKFRKWVPVRMMKGKIVHISQLISVNKPPPTAVPKRPYNKRPYVQSHKQRR